MHRVHLGLPGDEPQWSGQLNETIVLRLGRDYDRPVRAYALVEVGDPEAIDVSLRCEDAFAALEDCLRDEPDWEGVFCVAPIELDERKVSQN